MCEGCKDLGLGRPEVNLISLLTVLRTGRLKTLCLRFLAYRLGMGMFLGTEPRIHSRERGPGTETALT